MDCSKCHRSRSKGLQEILRDISVNFIDGDAAHFCQAEAISQSRDELLGRILGRIRG